MSIKIHCHEVGIGTKKIVYFLDGTFIEVPDGITWEYEQDENWSHTI